jgi:TolA-binding protein
MNKKELYQLLAEHKSLTVEEINSSLKGESSTDNSELNEFDQEALEGWIASGQTKVNISRISRRLGFSKSKRILLSSSIALLVFLSLYFWQNPAQPATNTTEKTTISTQLIEQTDIFLEPKFDTLVETASSTREIVYLQKTQSTKPLVTVSIVEPKSNLEVDKLPVKDIDLPKGKTEVVFSNRRKIKEVYLHTFKLVDYRVIRTKPTVATKQMDLTGTSANLENPTQKNEEVVWQNIDVPYIDYIEKTMYFMNKGSLKKAMARFDVILGTYPDDLNAQFYTGFSLYNLKEYEKAQSFFTEALQNSLSNFDEESAWYLALSYDQSGEVFLAKEWYTKIAESDSYYKNMAKKRLLKK